MVKIMPTPKRFTDEELRAHKNARAAQRYIENKEKISAYHSALHASKKSDPEYMKRLAEKSVAYRAAHPDYTKKMNAKRRADHPEREKARCREWFANNPDKRVAYQQNRTAKIRSVTGIVSVDIRTKLMVLQRGKCGCCKKTLVSGFTHLDHNIPITKGGAHDDLNMQLLCQTCNNQKYNKDPIQFMQEKGFLL